MRRYAFILLLIVSSTGFSQNRFSKNSVLRTIYELQDRRQAEALIPYLKHKKTIYREAAVLAFASVQDTMVKDLLLQILSTDKKTEVRNAAAYSLGQLYLPSLQKSLMAEFDRPHKTETKAIILEAIGKCATKEAIPFLEQVDIRPAMTEAYVRAVYFAMRRKVKSDVINEKIKSISASATEHAVLHLCSKILSVPKPEAPAVSGTRMSIPPELARDTLKTISNPYHQVEFLKKYTLFEEDLYMLSHEDYAIPVKTYCMETYLNTAKTISKPRLIYILNSRDVAYISLACERIRKDTLWTKKDSFALPVLRYVSEHLVLPRDLEAWIDVQKTIAFIQGTTYTYRTHAFQNPVDWKHVISIPEAQKVKLSTTKGDIILQCKVNDAPASVSNFLRLVDSGFYDQKYFHRMVPDFVVQGGCPRGDGWGSLNWIQRSEFSNWLRYKPGSVGLASAGKDSEGVQFFITHTYTSNLDGRYTIFAEVIEGMDVVNALVVGDRILKMERIN